MAYNLKDLEICIWLAARIKQFFGAPLPTSQQKIPWFLLKELKAFWFCFVSNGMVTKGSACAGHFWRTVLQGCASEILGSQCEGTRCSCKHSSQYLAFLQLFYKKLVSIEQHCLGNAAAELLGWLCVPEWGKEKELNKLSKDCLASLFSSMLMNKDLQLQIWWACNTWTEAGKNTAFLHLKA